LTTVLIADDHPMVRRGLREILSEMEDVQVIGEVTNGGEVVDAVATLKPDVLMLDVSMPDANFLDTLASMQERAPHVRTLVVSAHAEDIYARRALRAGAAGYITKSHADRELVIALRAVADGRLYISSELAQVLGSDIASGRAATPHNALTPRELEVMLLLSQGHTVTEISMRLHLSVKTVSTHRTRLLAKMQMSSNAELVRYALTHHLTH
jgi:two-component system invasion response regulator UvrY